MRLGVYAVSNSEAGLLDRHGSDAVTERLNKVYSCRFAEVDPALQRAQLSSLDKDDW
jgi:hypothetical protein